MAQKIARLLAILSGLALILLIITVAVPDNQYRVIFCDVGQGDAILITAPHHVQILIDGGPDQRVLTKLGRYMPFNDRTIELVMVTHPHADHLAGLLEVAKRYTIKQVIETDLPTSDMLASTWAELLRQKNIPTIIGQTGLAWQIDDDLSLRIIYASNRPAASVPDLNELSLVSLVSVRGRKFLMTGDMNLGMEETIMAKQLVSKVDVLKVAHHGSHFASGLAWLNLIHPNEAVISVGQPNRYGHPAPETLTRLQQLHLPFWRTDQSGDIRMILSPNGWVTQADKYVRMKPK